MTTKSKISKPKKTTNIVVEKEEKNTTKVDVKKEELSKEIEKKDSDIPAKSLCDKFEGEMLSQEWNLLTLSRHVESTFGKKAVVESHPRNPNQFQVKINSTILPTEGYYSLK
tara:strand:+ start:3748 stop:4083 length:336 start_codon:yes stop_codon:yes gene_type:complete